MCENKDELKKEKMNSIKEFGNTAMVEANKRIVVYQ